MSARLRTQLVVDALAAYRLTRLVTKDVILDGPRDMLIEEIYVASGVELPDSATRTAIEQRAGGWSEYAAHDGNAPKLATLLTCYWCAGFWISAGVIIARRVAPGLWDPLARILATSAVAALTAGLEQ